MKVKNLPTVNRIAFVGNSLPRRCGIATFTCHLREAVLQAVPHAQTMIVAVNDTSERYAYADYVSFEIAERELTSYHQAADFLNINDVDVVCLQHEFGIFGGSAGSHVLALLRDLRMPVITTLHTILREPNADQRRVMGDLTTLSDRLVSLSDRGAQFLREIYHVPPQKIGVIPHGIPDFAFVDPSFHKDKFKVEDKNVLLTFGLIGPGKGIETAIEAMPRILEKHPNTVYIILGATHPNLLRDQGELYRDGLQQRAASLGIEDSLIFYNRFVSEEELIEFLSVADIYITPYPNLAQICSGTLANAVGAGKAIVSTPYWHAEELLGDERGKLIQPNSPSAIADAVVELLDDSAARNAMRKRAFLYGRKMIWPKVAMKYMKAFENARASRCVRPRTTLEAKAFAQHPDELPALTLDHLYRLTDSTGIIQHATFSVPNYAEGYCVDDNARALILINLLKRSMDELPAGLPDLGSRYMAFMQFAYNPQLGRFRNFLSYDRLWLEEAGSEDSHGRALWALGTIVGSYPSKDLRQWAATLFEAALPATMNFTSPRAWAFTLLGIDEYLKHFAGDHSANDTRQRLARSLMDLYRANSDGEWKWFEDIVTYCNAKISQAMLVTGRGLDDDEMVDVGIESLSWLAELQTSSRGHFVPVGSNGFFRRGGERARFDQQPVEAHAMVSAALEAHRATGDERWWDEAKRAFEWFLGRNDLGIPVYDPTTGGCHDAIHSDRINHNQGAESTLAFLLSLAEMRQAVTMIDFESNAHRLLIA